MSIKIFRISAIIIAGLYFGFVFLTEYKISSLMMFLGILSNITALAVNKWKMPILVPKFMKYERRKDYIHSYYKNKGRIRGFWLCDIFSISKKRKDKIHTINYSIGDIMLAIGVILTFLRW